MRVTIDPGHGGSDPGAVGVAGTREKEHTLAVSLYLAQLFREAGIEAMLTRETDQDVALVGSTAGEELQARVNIANLAAADVFISIHANAAANPAAHGTETWYYQDGKLLADYIQREMAKLPLTDRGVKQANFYVLKQTYMPGVLIELAFISNPDEERLLTSEGFRKQAARAIYNGIMEWQQNNEC